MNDKHDTPMKSLESVLLNLCQPLEGPLGEYPSKQGTCKSHILHTAELTWLALFVCCCCCWVSGEGTPRLDVSEYPLDTPW